jgi:NAD(P)-dependent dehydrogenase (short-subunit alcohol dehydrogenase family)
VRVVGNVIRNGHDDRIADVRRAEAVAIVTGGGSGTGREVARGLARWGWAIVVVYLEQQRRAEVTVEEILAAEGRTVAVRADLADELDVRRLFAESIAAFGGIDVIVHTAAGSASVLYRHAAPHIRESGAIVSVFAAERMTPGVARQFRERGITIGRAPPGAMLSFLDAWRRRAIG